MCDALKLYTEHAANDVRIARNGDLKRSRLGMNRRRLLDKMSHGLGFGCFERNFSFHAKENFKETDFDSGY